MTFRWHVFYLGLIAVLLFALLTTGARLQQVTLDLNRTVTAKDLYAEIRKSPGQYQLLDMRDAEEFEGGHLPGTINLKTAALPEDAPVDRYRRTVIISEHGDADVYQTLAQEIKLAANMTGGMMQWRLSRLPEVTGLVDTDALRRGPVG